MHRTQIYLPETLHRTLRQRARTQGVTISFLIRKNLEEKLHRPKIGHANDVFKAIMEAGKRVDWRNAPRDLSDPKLIDKFVYGK